MTDTTSEPNAEHGVNIAVPGEIPTRAKSPPPPHGVRLFAISGAGKTDTAAHYLRSVNVRAEDDQVLPSTSA